MKYLLNCRSFISLIVLFSFFDNFGVKKYDYQFKVLIVGDAVVGKTQIVSRYVKDSFVEEYKYTEGIGLGSKSISFNNKNINLQLYDTSGQERYRTIRQSYYKGSQLIVLVYAINNKNSFNSIPKWVDEVKKQTDKNTKFLLVGNKCDLEEERLVSKEDAKQYAEEKNIGFIEVSAKTGDGIKDMFEYIISELLEDMKKEENKNIEKDIEFNKHEINNSQNDNNNQKKNHIEKKNFPFCDKYCSCCPCLKKSEGNVKNIEPVIF